jgi:hypothetical protein
MGWVSGRRIGMGVRWGREGDSAECGKGLMGGGIGTQGQRGWIAAGEGGFQSKRADGEGDSDGEFDPLGYCNSNNYENYKAINY